MSLGLGNTLMNTLTNTPKTVNPSILNCQFISEKDGFEAVCRPIWNKPKPKAEPPKEEAKKTEASDAAPAAEDLKKSAEEAAASATPMDESSTVNGGSEKQEQTMDLD